MTEIIESKASDQVLPKGQFFVRIKNEKLSSQKLKPGDVVRFDINESQSAKPGDVIVVIYKNNHSGVKIMSEGDVAIAKAIQYQIKVRNELTGE